MSKKNERLYQTVLKQLAKLNMMMTAQVEDAIVQEKALIFTEDLVDWSPDTVNMAFDDFRQNSPYWPTVSEIISRCRTASQALEYQRQRETPALEMPDHLPEKVRRENIKQIAKLKKRLGKAMARPGAVQDKNGRDYTMPQEQFRDFMAKRKTLQRQIDAIMREEPIDG